MVGKQCLKDSVGEQRGQKVVKEVLGGGEVSRSVRSQSDLFYSSFEATKRLKSLY